MSDATPALPLRIYRSLAAAEKDAPAGALPRVVAAGFYDGVHLGHRALLRELAEWGAEAGAEPAVLTFDPHPLEVLRSAAPAKVVSLEHRLLLLASSGVRTVLVLPFDVAVSRWSAAEFVSRAMRDALRARYVLMGFDSAWGHERAGSFAELTRLAPDLGVEIRRAGVERLGGRRVSSTLVRDAVRNGSLAELSVLLGRDFSVLGEVVRGHGRGHELGFPTANIRSKADLDLPSGVYFAEVSRWGRLDLDPSRPVATVDAAPPATRANALVNIGSAPTFGGGDGISIEAYLVPSSESTTHRDEAVDLYGETIEIHFLERHRDEIRFDSPRELAEQIRRDVDAHGQFVARR